MTQITTGMVYQADKSRLCVSKINQDSQVVLMTDLTTKHDFPITITDFQRGIAQGLYVRENLEKDTSRSHSRVIDVTCPGISYH